MTTLPKRNPFLLAIYMLAVVMMFVFIIWIVLYPYATPDYDDTTTGAAYDQGDFGSATVEPAVAIQAIKKTTADTTSHIQISNTNVVAGLVPEQRQPLRLASISGQLDLQRPLQPQIDNIWQRFIKADLLNKVEITNSTQVYAVYHGYREKTQRLSMTLGYVINNHAYMPTGVTELQVSGGRYLRLTGESVLDNWDKPQRFGDALKFTADYELYLLNENYQVLNQVAFLAVN